MSVESLFIRSIVRRRPLRIVRQIAYCAVVLSVLALLLATAVLPGLNQAAYLAGASYDGKARIDGARNGSVATSQDNVVVNGRVEAGVLLAERNVSCLLCSPSTGFEYETSDFSDGATVKGKPSRALEPDEIALSTPLAKSLDAALGDEVYVLNMSSGGDGDYFSYTVASILACQYSSGSEAALGGAGIAFVKPSSAAETLLTDKEHVVYYRGAPPAEAEEAVAKADEIDGALGFLGNGIAYGTVIALAGTLLLMIARRELSYTLAEHGKSIAVLYSCGAPAHKMVGALAAKEFVVLVLSGAVALAAIKIVVESPLVLLSFPWPQLLLFLAALVCIEAVVIVVHTRRALAEVEAMDVCKLLAKGVGDE